MTTIEHDDERIMFASDVQGPMDDAALRVILSEKPQMLIIGGPPLYLVDFRVSEQQIQRGLKNLRILAGRISTVILEHHLLRDAGWRDAAKQVFEKARDSRNIVATAAEFLGEEDRLLEAKRKQLFKEEPPASDFEHWSRLPEFEQKKTQPPL